MKAFNFYKEDQLKEVDIIIETPVSYEKARKNIVRVKSGDMTLPVISINNLILMKKSTGRSIDRLDVEQLKRIRKLRKGL